MGLGVFFRHVAKSSYTCPTRYAIPPTIESIPMTKSRLFYTSLFARNSIIPLYDRYVSVKILSFKFIDTPTNPSYSWFSSANESMLISNVDSVCPIDLLAGWVFWALSILNYMCRLLTICFGIEILYSRSGLCAYLYAASLVVFFANFWFWSSNSLNINDILVMPPPSLHTKIHHKFCVVLLNNFFRWDWFK